MPTTSAQQFEADLKAAKNGDTVKLKGNIVKDIVINKLVNLDLNGKTIKGNVTINTEAKGKINLTNGTIDGNLTVDALQATVTNELTVTGDVNINNVAVGTWNEKANGNKLIVNDPDGITLNVAAGATVDTLTLNQPTTVTVAPTASFTNPVIVKAESTIVSENTVSAVVDRGVKVTVKSDKEDTGREVIGTGGSSDLVSEEVAPKLSMPNTLTASTEEKIANNNGGIGQTFDTTGRTPINVQLTKGSDDYKNVRIVVEGADEGLQLIAQDTAGNWYDIAKTGWGPEAGFQIANATTSVFVVANQAGTFNVTVNLVDVANNNKVLATTSGTVTVLSNKAKLILTAENTKYHTGTNSNGVWTKESNPISLEGDTLTVHFTEMAFSIFEMLKAEENGTVSIVDANGTEVDPDNMVGSGWKVIVTSQDGKVTKEYTIDPGF